MNRTGKTLLMILALVSSLSTVQAQRGGAWNSSPEERANKQTAMMADSLTLSDAQKEKIAEVNLKYAKKLSAARMEARENADGDRSAMRTMMRTMRTEQNTELKKYLTTEQFTKWEKIETERRANRRGGGKGRRGGKGKKQTEENN